MPVNERIVVDTFLRMLDLGGTFVFAIGGGAVGVKHRLDLFGVLVLSFVAANFGGITRDVLIGAVPPAAIRDWRYIAISVLAGVLTFYWYPATRRQHTPLVVLDAIGLSLFSVAGTQKALAYHLGPIAAPILGMLTGIGGGLVRDVLVSDVPNVFRAEIYAVAALSGALVVVLGDILHLPSNPMALAGALVCFGFRMFSIRRGWHLPVAPPPEGPEA
ncbi:MAG: trimeric intracellular cation channel family protein [Acidobacteria bacterium]|nr:trimeric intracellular cation channel family protein [Acidobacteriota bacterium]